jgi:hypothetical protein
MKERQLERVIDGERWGERMREEDRRGSKNSE